MPSQKPDPEVAQANAELASAHVEAAQEAAAEADRQLAQATKSSPRVALCSVCNGETIKHPQPKGEGIYHCNFCGTCKPEP